RPATRGSRRSRARSPTSASSWTGARGGTASPCACRSRAGRGRPTVPRALIVDDDADTRDALAEGVSLGGFERARAGSLAEARKALAKAAPDVVLVDLMLPDGKGLDLLEAFEDGPRPQLVLITGNATVETAVEALRTGARDYLVKPVEMGRLKAI